MKRKYRCEFRQDVRERIRDRDGGCIFCRMGYRMDADQNERYGQFLQVMHYIGRAQGGLGIEENGALGCAKHHTMLDDSRYRSQMRPMMADYLAGIYPDWDPGKLVYDKWAFLRGNGDEGQKKDSGRAGQAGKEAETESAVVHGAGKQDAL